MGADLPDVLAQRRLLVLDDVEHLPRRVHPGRGAHAVAELGRGVVATAQRVCGTTRTRSTPSRCTPRTIASRAASVTRPPGLRKIFASPGCRPMQPQRVDPGVHAGHHGDPRVGDAVELLHARSSRRSVRFAASRSSKSWSVTGHSLPSVVQQAGLGAENGWTWLAVAPPESVRVTGERERSVAERVFKKPARRPASACSPGAHASDSRGFSHDVLQVNFPRRQGRTASRSPNRYRSRLGKSCGPCGADHLVWCCMGRRATKELTEATQRLETSRTGDEPVLLPPGRERPARVGPMKPPGSPPRRSSEP